MIPADHSNAIINYRKAVTTMKTRSEKIIDTVLLVFLIIYIVFAVFPTFKELRANTWISLGVSIALTAVLFYYTWIRQRKPSWPGKISATVLGLLYIWLSWIVVSNRIYCIINIVLSVIAACVLIHEMFFYSKNDSIDDFSVIMVETVLFCSRMVLFTTLTEEIHGFLSSVFPYIALAFALIVGVVGYLILKDKKLPTKVKRRNKKEHKEIATVTVCFIAITALIFSYLALANLNFALDTSEPTPYVCEIIDKEMSAGAGKYRKSYRRIQVEIDGKTKWLDITASEYDFYKIGDTVTINLYEGALGEPYLISDNND